MREHSKLQKEIEMPVLLACAIEVSTGIFRISAGGFEHPKPPLGMPLTNHEVPLYTKSTKASNGRPFVPCITFWCQTTHMLHRRVEC